MIWSCSVTMTCVMVRVACEASVLRGWPRTLDLAMKSASHTAVSPVPRGGIFAGGAARSNLWLAYATGSLVISTASFRSCGADETSGDVWQPQASPPTNTQDTMNRRNGIRPPRSIFRETSSHTPPFCVIDDAKGTAFGRSFQAPSSESASTN